MLAISVNILNTSVGGRRGKGIRTGLLGIFLAVPSDMSVQSSW